MKKNKEKPEVEEIRQDPFTMGLRDLRFFMETKIEWLSFYLPAENYQIVTNWIKMPLAEFEKKWEECKTKNISLIEAKKEFLRMTGAYKETKKGYDDAVVIPENYRGPILANVIEWRFRELSLVNYAKEKNINNLEEKNKDVINAEGRGGPAWFAK